MKHEDAVCPFCGAREPRTSTETDPGTLPWRVAAMIAVATVSLTGCEDDTASTGAKPVERALVDVAPADAGKPTAPVDTPVRRDVTVAPPYGVAMPPPRDEGAAVPAYGAPPPRPVDVE